eukprot:TRINITY_DN9645_c0_g1_i3.p1 TRINITY_DN9645_c0_g1~~TRINITY_DN9645_c0_g1_i3.p1  ORF type:complete len:396 (+),score=116.04 TRINITY_DN9645_c0_g1_i3:33-1220(+)
MDREAAKAVFDTFDKNGSGTLSLEEMIKAGNEFGSPLDIDAARKFFKAMDKNHDYRVDFEEFFTWLQYGKESDSKFGLLVQKAFAAKKSLQSVTKVLSPANFKDAQGDLDEYRGTLRLGEFEPNNFIQAKLHFASSGIDEEYQRLTKGISTEEAPKEEQKEKPEEEKKEQNPAKSYPELIIGIKAIEPEKALAFVKEKVAEMLQLMTSEGEDMKSLADSLAISFGIDEGRVKVKILVKHPLVGDILEEYTKAAETAFADEKSEGARLSFRFSTKHNLQALFTSEKSIIELLLDGFHVSASADVNTHMQELINEQVLLSGKSLLEQKESSISQFLYLLLRGAHVDLTLQPQDFTKLLDTFKLHGLKSLPDLSLIHISEPTRLLSISYAVFCLKKKT